MHQRKARKNKHISFWLAIMCVCLVSFIVPGQAQAYDFNSTNLVLKDNTTGDTCPGGGCDALLSELKQPTAHNIEVCPGPKGLTRRIIPCVKETIIQAVNKFLMPFSEWMASTVKAACILAVIAWAAKMVSATETAPLKDGMLTAVKVAMVLMFAQNFGSYDVGGNTKGSLDPAGVHHGNFGLLLDMMDEMLGLVTSYVVQSNITAIAGAGCQTNGEGNQVYAIWDRVDCILEILVGGIFSPLTLSAGLIGFITACLFSNTLGVAVGLTCFYLIFRLVLALIRCCYVFISAYMGVAFMVVISPLFVPCLLFKPTKGYFDKWLKVLVSFMIQPMILFAYMSMLMAVFDTVVFGGSAGASGCDTSSIYGAIAGKDASFCQPIDSGGYGQRIGTWMIQNGGYTDKDFGGQAIAIDVKNINATNLIPKNAELNGLVSKISAQFLNVNATDKNGVFETLGIDPAKPNFFEIDIPEQTINWDKLAVANGYGTDTTSYILNVLVSAVMALLMGYVFVDVMNIIPFIGSGIANYGRAGEGINTSLASDKAGGAGSSLLRGISFGGLGSIGG